MIRTPSERSRREDGAADWGNASPTFVGWFPALTVVVGAGLVLVALGNAAAGRSVEWAPALFWAGLLTVFAPAAIRVAMPNVSRFERVADVTLVATALYLVKVMHSPLRFAFGDEYQHLRTVQDIVATGHLFSANPLSIASPVYPGMEIATAAVTQVSGVPVFIAGLLIIGLARLLLTLALFRIIETLTLSSRAAAIGSFLYAGSSTYMFFSAQFGYESLALPLAVFGTWLTVVLVRTTAADVAQRRSLLVALALTGAAIVMTHHLTSYAVLALLVVWTVAAWLVGRLRGPNAIETQTYDPAPSRVRSPAFLIPFMALLTAGWFLVFGPATSTYLVPVVSRAFNNLFQTLTGTVPIRAAFDVPPNPLLVTPGWERIVAFAAVALTGLLIAFSLVILLTRVGPAARYRRDPLVWALAGIAALFPVFQAMRLAGGTAEIANRSSEFVFVGVSLLLALAIGKYWLESTGSLSRPVMLGLVATGIFAGGVIVGMPNWARMPGPYLVSGDTRAIQPQGLMASDWLRQSYGSGNRLIADETNKLLMSTDGQYGVSGLSWIFFSPRLEEEERDELIAEGVRFVVVDERMTSMLPTSGHFYENGEPHAGEHEVPMDPQQLAKFDRSPNFDLVFDSGAIKIYEFAA